MAEEKKGSYVKSGDIEEWRWDDEKEAKEEKAEPKAEKKETKK